MQYRELGKTGMKLSRLGFGCMRFKMKDEKVDRDSGVTSERSSMSHQAQERLHVYFSGWVQGVGFRFTTIRIARDYAVTGFVRNLPDGRVELAAEGTRSELESFLGAIQGRMGRYIDEAHADWLPADNEFKNFDIRY